MQLKANSIQHLTDARYFAAQGVEWLGFDLNVGSPNTLSPKQIIEIRGWLSGPQFMGEFSAMQPANEIAEAVEMLALDAVQIDSFIDLNNVYSSVNVPIIQKWNIESLDDLASLSQPWTLYQAKVQSFLLRLPQPWEQIQQNAAMVDILANLCRNFSVWLDIDFVPAQLPQLRTALSFDTLCLNGGAEERVGYKSFDELDEVFDLLAAF